MALKELLWQCLQEGKRSYQEPRTGKGAKLEPVNDECVLLFVTDSQPFREAFDLVDKKVSDMLVFCKVRNQLPKIILVELKSGDYKEAAEQIKNVARLLFDKLGKKGTDYRAVIALSTNAPTSSESQKLQREFSILGIDLKYAGGCTGKKPPLDLRKLIG